MNTTKSTFHVIGNVGDEDLLLVKAAFRSMIQGTATPFEILPDGCVSVQKIYAKITSMSIGNDGQPIICMKGYAVADNGTKQPFEITYGMKTGMGYGTFEERTTADEQN